MKQYDSISRDFMEFDAYIFDKVDGSQIRVEWTKKTGWNKFGTRHRLLDQSDTDFGIAIPLFLNNYAADLEKVIKKERWQKIIAFMELSGEHSLGGLHEDEPKKLTLFDFNPYKKGILPPKEYIKLFGHLEFSAKFLGLHKWNRQLIQDIRDDKFDGISFEGVVGKALVKNRIIMRKAKTQKWIDAIKERYDSNIANEIINS